MVLINIEGDMPPAPADIAEPAVLLDSLRTSNHLRKVSAHRAMVDSWYPKESTFSQFLLNRFGGTEVSNQSGTEGAGRLAYRLLLIPAAISLALTALTLSYNGFFHQLVGPPRPPPAPAPWTCSSSGRA